MIETVLSPQCTALIRLLRIAPSLVEKAINDRHQGCVSDGLDRVIVAHWLSDELLILVDSTVSKKTFEPPSTVRFDQVVAQLAIVLPSELPAGVINRQMSMEEVLAVAAASFGRPVRCHPDEPYANLYAGRWDGEKVEVQTSPGETPGGFYFCGSFNPELQSCELVWIFDIERYR
jgi:hypothetical protein